MKEISLDLGNLNEVFPDNFTQEQIAKGRNVVNITREGSK